MLKSRLIARIWGGVMPFGVTSSSHIPVNMCTRKRGIKSLHFLLFGNTPKVGIFDVLLLLKYTDTVMGISRGS